MDERPMFCLTLDEAQELYDALGSLLGARSEAEARRREVAELKRKLRLAHSMDDARIEAIKQLLARVDGPLEDVRKEKDTRDRDILSNFLLTRLDNKDDAVVCVTCCTRYESTGQAVEPVPRSSTLLAVYFVARSHMEKHHKGEIE